MGHSDKTSKNIRSTKPTPDISSDKECEPASPESLHFYNTETTHLIFAAVGKSGRVYNDQVGQFHSNSSKGKNYVCLMYDYDAKYIIIYSLKNQTGQEILRFY